MDAVALRHFCTLYEAGVVGNWTDAQLVERFLSGRGETAEACFAALVERHGPMVLRVCRQILHDSHDAEDAVQTTFLVLARNAGAIRKRASLASWLYGIAHRVAMRCRAATARRRAQERHLAKMMPREPTGSDDPYVCWTKLHEEVARLPEKYRLPVLLCYIEGLTTEAAAGVLGCPQGTILSRLARARARLRQRLSGPDAAVTAWLLGGHMAPAPVLQAIPAALSRSLAQAARRIAASGPMAGVVPARVATLTDEVLKSMFHSKLKAMVATAAGALGVGFLLLGHRAAQANKPDTTASQPASARAAARQADHPSGKENAGASEIIARVADLARDILREGFAGFVAINPETGAWRPIWKGLSLASGRVSPDGRYLVASKTGQDLDDKGAGVWVYDLKGESLPRRVFERKGAAVWSHDGQKVVISAPVGRNWEKIETWSVSADGSARTKLPLPEGELVLDCSRDGTWLAARSVGGKRENLGRLVVMHPDGTGMRVLNEGSAQQDRFSIFRFSPDGRKIACVEISIDGAFAPGRRFIDGVRHPRVFIVDVDGSNRREIPAKFEPGTTVDVRWSPDGSRLALNVLDGRTKQGSVDLVDIDGSHRRQLPLPPGNWNLLVCDWKAIAHAQRVANLDEPGDPKSPSGQYQALREEIRQAESSYAEASRAARTSEERESIYQDKYPHARSYVSRFHELAESAPDDPAAVDALIWVVQFGFDGPAYSRAIDCLAERHASLRRVGNTATSLVHSVSPSVEKLLRAVIEKNADPSIKGRACLALGQFLKEQSMRVRSIKEDPESVSAWRATFRKEGAPEESWARFLRQDPDALLTAAETMLERVVREFGNEPGRRKSIADEARTELFEIRSLCPGKPAPEIIGRDIDDKPFKLSDYKGKAVLLSFCADWCASRKDIYVYQHALTEKTHGRPFVVLGVNGDSKRDKLWERMKAGEITWRSFCDGGENINSPGPIALQFNVEVWPTLYLIDHQGVIRSKFRGSPGKKRLDIAVESLIKAAEAPPREINGPG